MKSIGIIEKATVLEIRMKKILRKHGYHEISAFKFDELCMAKLKMAIKNIDLMIIDLDYDNKYLIDIIKKINEYGNNKTIIIGLTHQSNISFLKKMIYFGCHDFLTKPFNNEQLMLKVNRHLSKGIQNDFYQEYTLTQINHENDKKILIKWFKDYSIGVKEVDDEHKELIEVFQKLYYLMKKGKGKEYYNEIVQFLRKYIKNHFKNEEKLQQAIHYPNYNEHRKIHENFKESLNQIISEQRNHNVNNQDLIKISLFLKNWLMHHILVEDNKIGEYIKDNINKEDLK